MKQINIEMVPVKGGTYLMGSPESDEYAYRDEKPQHEVTLSDFEIGKYPVTQAQWESVMGSNPSHFKGSDLPVETVSWDDVQEFIKKLNQQTGRTYRLPTEAEWEYAARGGQSGIKNAFLCAGSNNIDEVAWYYENSGSKTHPIGGKKPNELGLYDMSGNVWEWCSDWCGTYPTNARTDPKGPSTGGYRVLRGGSCFHVARYCRAALRYRGRPAYRYGTFGFRLALQVHQVSKKGAEQPKGTGRDDRAKGPKKERKKLNDRFIQALDHLESQGTVQRYSHRKKADPGNPIISYGDLAVIMGDRESALPTSRIADYRNEKRFIDYPEAIRFAEAFPVRKEWLCFGEGDMLPDMFVVDIETEGIIAIKCEKSFQDILKDRFEAMQHDKGAYGYTK